MNDGIYRRSINIQGKVTSIALEPVFWNELDRRANEAGISWADYSRQLFKDMGQVHNRASALKQHLMGTTPATAQLTLIDVTGPKGTVRLRCTGNRLVIGRGANHEIRLSDSQVSREHAVLIRIDMHWWVGDLQSKNGTWIGKEKVKFQHMPTDKALRIGHHQVQIVH